MTDDELYAGLQETSFRRSTRATSESLDRRMTGSAIAEFLAEKRYAAVATTRRDGRPHAAMTGFLAHAGAVWLPVMAGTSRAGNVRGQPYVVVVVTEAEGPQHVMVSLEGPAEVVDHLPDEVVPVWLERTGSAAPPDWAVAWIRVDVTRLFSYAGPESGREIA